MKIAESGWLYDWGQTVTGATRSRLRLKALFQRMLLRGLVLDVGGGTGAILPYLPKDSRYICLDSDRLKLQRLRHCFPAAPTLLSDATRLAIRSNSVDAVLAIALPHHLEGTAFERMLGETSRVLKPSGRLFLIEPLAAAQWTARLLWRLDRGSYPRACGELLAAVGRHLSVVYQERYSILHDYLIVVGVKGSPPPV
jgi:ubiquinone/menaquinone biosynthesis C-methylase UbiE